LFGTENGKNDVKLPPVAHAGILADKLRKYSIWGRHKIDRELVVEMGHIYCMVPPPAMGGGLVKLVVNISDPELVKQVLQDSKTFPTRGKSGLSDTVGEGLVELPTGSRHSFHRRIIGSLLTDKHLVKYTGTVRAETIVLVHKWGQAASEGTVVNAHYDLACCTHEIIGLIGLGQRFGSQLIREEENMDVKDTAFMMRRAAMSSALGANALRWLSSSEDVSRESRIRESGYKETTDRIGLALGQKGRNGKSGKDTANNMVQAMRNAVDEDGARLTEQEVIDEFITIRGAGHETTSNTLSWALLLLAQHQDQQQMLFEETKKYITGLTPTFEEVENLSFTKCCLYETLRLYPTVPSFPRLSVKDTTLGGYDLPAGTYVFVSQSALNRRKDLWGSDADTYKPDRFNREGYSLELMQSMPKGCPPIKDGDNPDVARRLFGFAPFGAGKRTCPGQRLALLESAVILASLIKHFKIEVSNGGKAIEERADITLGPKLGLPLKLTFRNKEAYQRLATLQVLHQSAKL
jgi:cytochrome P450/NADPH-cytochrome P450 reductase